MPKRSKNETVQVPADLVWVRPTGFLSSNDGSSCPEVAEGGDGFYYIRSSLAPGGVAKFLPQELGALGAALTAGEYGDLPVVAR